ncbi:MAG: hypothetical protein IKZ90_08420 [Clostridiales bacterium]|nr:hypothetical protein [Clostridiales bacterium]
MGNYNYSKIGRISFSASSSGMMGMPANGFMGMAMTTQPGGDTASANVPDDTDASMWTCACGNRNEGKFCSNCGCKRP